MSIRKKLKNQSFNRSFFKQFFAPNYVCLEQKCLRSRNVSGAEISQIKIYDRFSIIFFFFYFPSEFLEHTNYTFHTNGTLTYYPKRTVKFVPERSIGDPKIDIVTVPNIPYLGASSAAAEMSVFAGM